MLKSQIVAMAVPVYYQTLVRDKYWAVITLVKPTLPLGRKFAVVRQTHLIVLDNVIMWPVRHRGQEKLLRPELAPLANTVASLPQLQTQLILRVPARRQEVLVPVRHQEALVPARHQHLHRLSLSPTLSGLALWKKC